MRIVILKWSHNYTQYIRNTNNITTSVIRVIGKIYTADVKVWTGLGQDNPNGAHLSPGLF